MVQCDPRASNGLLNQLGVYSRADAGARRIRRHRELHADRHPVHLSRGVGLNPEGLDGRSEQLVTSKAYSTAAIPVDNPCCSCELTRVFGPGSRSTS